MQPSIKLREWVRSQLAPVADRQCVLVRDPLHLLPENDGVLHTFAREHGFTVIVAATNLVFRDLYERALTDQDTQKFLLVDRAPQSRRAAPTLAKAPPPFYPDFLARTPPDACIDLNLREFLHQCTGDSHWPVAANDARYARLIARYLDGVLRAHANLRVAQSDRFTDHDFKTIVAYAALGISDMAFKKLDPQYYWRIGLLGHDALAELEALVPEITHPIRHALRKAPAPFCWFGERDPDTILRAVYLAVILRQHLSNWRLLLANVDPALAAFNSIDESILSKAVPGLVRLDDRRADRDLTTVENSLSKDALQLLLLNQMKVDEPTGAVAVIEKEAYSTLLRSLALLSALDNLLSVQPGSESHKRLAAMLFPGAIAPTPESVFADKRPSIAWSQLKTAYGLATEVCQLREQLADFVRTLGVKRTPQLSFQFFWESWNGKRINRLEYYISALERLTHSGDLLPRTDADLPSAFINALDRVKQRIHTISGAVQQQLDAVNRRFQELVVAQYPTWLETDGEVRLTSQFIRRCLKPHWDPEREKAAIFIFDGMRYDIWDEMLRPMLLDRMEVIEEFPAASMLPSETEVSRWALSAGTDPASFWPRKAENVHLQESLQREFGIQCQVEVVAPAGAGTGETVRYRAGNLDVYIFEFCDKELHKVQVRNLPDGREVPSRPLAFIYQQHLKSLIDNEVMAIVRSLAPETKVFITADHGFARVHRERIWLEATWLNEPEDCSYRNSRLRESLEQVKASAKVRENVWELPVEKLKLPRTEEARDRRTKATWEKRFATMIFPKTGYALSRPNAHFNPDAYTHGGISLEELLIPMIVLRVKSRDEGILRIESVAGPDEIVEGEEAEFRIRLSHSAVGGQLFDELRVDLEAVVTALPTSGQAASESQARAEPSQRELPAQVLYVATQPCDAVFRINLTADDVTPDERRAGRLDRIITITASYHDGRRIHRKSRTHRFAIQLNAEQVVRRVGNLGTILGLMPKSLRGVSG